MSSDNSTQVWNFGIIFVFLLHTTHHQILLNFPLYCYLHFMLSLHIDCPPFKPIIMPCLDHYIGFLHSLSEASFASTSMPSLSFGILGIWIYLCSLDGYHVLQAESRGGTGMLVVGDCSQRFANMLYPLYLDTNSQQCSVLASGLWTSVYVRHTVAWIYISPPGLHSH